MIWSSKQNLSNPKVRIRFQGSWEHRVIHLWHLLVHSSPLHANYLWFWILVVWGECLLLGCTDLDEAGRKVFIARTRGGMIPREHHPEWWLIGTLCLASKQNRLVQPHSCEYRWKAQVHELKSQAKNLSPYLCSVVFKLSKVLKGISRTNSILVWQKGL